MLLYFVTIAAKGAAIAAWAGVDRARVGGPHDRTAKGGGPKFDISLAKSAVLSLKILVHAVFTANQPRGADQMSLKILATMILFPDDNSDRDGSVKATVEVDAR